MNKETYTLITGASSGIGFEVAKKFAKRGKNLIIVARRIELLKQLKIEINNEFPNITVLIKEFDLSDINNVYKLYSDLIEHHIETMVNNAGFGAYGTIGKQDLTRIEEMIKLNIIALTVLSSLYVNDYKYVKNSQLINISSAGGYTIVPNATTYCATKFYVSSFTEGLAHELKKDGALLQAKVLAPAATKTEFGKIANNLENYDYDKNFNKYHSSEQMASFLLKLYDSNFSVGLINRNTFEFELSNPIFDDAYESKNNQTQ